MTERELQLELQRIDTLKQAVHVKQAKKEALEGHKRLQSKLEEKYFAMKCAVELEELELLYEEATLKRRKTELDEPFENEK